MRSLLVLGASGLIGSGMVAHFLRLGDTLVIAPTKSGSSTLNEAIAGLSTTNLLNPQIPYYDENGPEELASWIAANVPGGKVNHIFSVSGGMADFGSVSSVTMEQYLAAINSKVTTQFKFCRTFIPLLTDEPSSTFTIVTGVLGEMCFAPQFALTCIGNAAVYGLTVALQSQEADKAYRINEFRIGSVIRKDGASTDGVDVSKLTKFYYDKIVSSDVKGSIVRVSPADLV